jgi:peptide/nickel transport system substrate-binding protein
MTDDGVLRVALDWSVDAIDPPRSFGGWNTGRVVQQTHESLMEDDFDAASDGPPGGVTRIVPRLAEDCAVDPDHRRFVFRLRRGVRFHDGAPLDADAVVMNYARLWDRGSPMFSAVAADLNRMGVEAVRQVRALDPMTVEIELSDPFPEFLRYMTQEDAPGAQSLISPAALLRHGPDGCGDRAPGTGAFRFATRFETAGGSSVELARNDDYWGAPSKLTGIRFIPFPDLSDRVRALVEGEVDVAYSLEGADLDDLAARGFVVPELAPPFLWYLAFNMRDRWAADLRVRRAIAHAIDRRALCDALFPGACRPATGIAPPGSPAHDPEAADPWPHDPARARALLAEAGAPEGLTLRALGARAGSAQLDPAAIYARIAADLAAVGVRLEVDLHHDWVSYCNGWRAGAPDGVSMTEMSWGMSCDAWLDQILHGRNAAPGGFNAGCFDDPATNALLDRARGETSHSARVAFYRQVADRAAATLPVLPLLTSRRGMIAFSPRVHGLRPVNQCWFDFRGASIAAA